MERGDNEILGSFVNLISGFGGLCSGCRIVCQESCKFGLGVGFNCLKFGRGISGFCGCRTPLLQWARPFVVGVQFPQRRFVSLQ